MTVTELANLTESKKGGDEVIPLEFNLPSLSWTLLTGPKTWDPILHIIGEEKSYGTELTELI